MMSISRSGSFRGVPEGMGHLGRIGLWLSVVWGIVHSQHFFLLTTIFQATAIRGGIATYP